MCICVHVYVCVHVCVSVHMCVHDFVCMHVCVLHYDQLLPLTSDTATTRNDNALSEKRII